MSEEQKAPQFKDFDKVIRPERKARIAGEDVDVSKIPSRVTLEMAKLSDDAKELNSEEGFYKSVDLVAKACAPSNPKITAEWLLDYTDFIELMEFMDWVLEPVKKRTEETEKNMKARAGKKNNKK